SGSISIGISGSVCTGIIMLETQFQNDVSFHLTGEAKSGSGGDQPARNILSDWNGHGGINGPQFQRIIPRENTLENALPV
ncbi:MAG: hypothetical protein WCJ95_21215, partial [Mariniphaga sp.]